MKAAVTEASDSWASVSLLEVMVTLTEVSYSGAALTSLEMKIIVTEVSQGGAAVSSLVYEGHSDLTEPREGCSYLTRTEGHIEQSE